MKRVFADIIMFSEKQIESCDHTNLEYDTLPPAHYLSISSLDKMTEDQQQYTAIKNIQKTGAQTTETTYEQGRIKLSQSAAKTEPGKGQYSPELQEVTKIREKLFSKVTVDPGQDKAGQYNNQLPSSDGQRKSRAPKVSSKPTTMTHISHMEDIPEDIAVLSMEQMCDCLKILNMEQYTDFFKKHQINGSLLKELDEPMLISEGVSAFDARKLIMFSKKHWRPT